MDVVNGLHDFLENDEEIASTAKRHNRRLFDVRKPPMPLPVGAGTCKGFKAARHLNRRRGLLGRQNDCLSET